MSVATELTRIQSAKDALKTSIRNKGVSVSDDALISAYPALVDAIETGGGDSFYETVNVIPTSFGPKNTIKSVHIPEGVTIIDAGAFEYYHELESVTLPSTLEEIGGRAFYDCPKLASPITLPSTVAIKDQSVFEKCSSLTYVNIDTFPNSYTFQNCPNIATLIIGKHCTNFGNQTFDYGIKGTITVDPENTYFSVVTGCLVSSNKNLYLGTPSATIPSGVKSIYEGAFRGLTNFTGNITIPSSVTTIESRAFNRTGITSFSTNDTMTSFNANIIGDCQNLLSVYIGKAITSFDGYDGYWPNVTSIVVNSENTTYDSRDNCNAVISTSSNQMRKGCTTTVIPSSVTSLSSHCFKECNIQSIVIPDSVTSFGDETFMASGLQSITIGTGVTQIPYRCFHSCTSLTSIDLPDNVTSIDGGSSSSNEYYGAFNSCTSLTTVTIGTGVTSIENNAFNGCTSLSSVTIKATTPPTLGGSNVFDNNASGRKIYVPAESVDAYKAASNWKKYAADIEAIPSV